MIGVIMPYTMEDFERDFTEEHLHLLSTGNYLQSFFPRTTIERIAAGRKIERIAAGRNTEKITIRSD